MPAARSANARPAGYSAPMSWRANTSLMFLSARKATSLANCASSGVSPFKVARSLIQTPIPSQARRSARSSRCAAMLFELRRLVRHHRNQLMVQLLRPRFGGALVVAFAVLHQQGKHLSEQFGRGPACERDMMRRVVVAGEQSPELALAQNGYRHRGRDAHVLQVFDVDRRDAAQDAHREVEGLSLAVELWLDLGGLRIDVGNGAQPVAFVENPRLAWNVRRR